jgi:hypothetical protein
MVGGFKLRLSARTAVLDEVCCPVCAAAGRGRHLLTLTHTFVTCPEVAPAAGWLTAAFGALLAAHQPGHPPPPGDPLLLLADAPWVLQPPALLHTLWTRFRVAYLGVAWDLHTAGFDPGLGSFAEALVAGVVETLRRAVTRDRMRVLTDVRALGREVGVPAVWFRGRSPLLLPEAFVRLWPNPGRWYVDPGGPIQPGLLQLPDPAAFHVRLSANWPVALGGGPPPGL